MATKKTSKTMETMETVINTQTTSSEIKYLTQENIENFQLNPYNPRGEGEANIALISDENNSEFYRLSSFEGLTKDYETKFNDLLDSLVSIIEGEARINVINPLRVTPIGAVSPGKYTVLSGNTRLGIIRQVLLDFPGAVLNVPYFIDNQFNSTADLLSTALIDNQSVPLGNGVYFTVLDNAFEASSEVLGEDADLKTRFDWIRDTIVYASNSSPNGNKRIPASALSRWKIKIENPVFYGIFSEYMKEKFISRFYSLVSGFNDIDNNIDYRMDIIDIVKNYLKKIKKTIINLDDNYTALKDLIISKYGKDESPLIDSSSDEQENGDSEGGEQADNPKDLTQKLELAIGEIHLLSKRIDLIKAKPLSDFENPKKALQLINRLEKTLKELQSMGEVVIQEDTNLNGEGMIEIPDGELILDTKESLSEMVS